MAHHVRRRFGTHPTGHCWNHSRCPSRLNSSTYVVDGGLTFNMAQQFGACQSMLRPFTFTGPQGVRNAWIIWACVFIIIVSIVAISPDRRTVGPVYGGASSKWFAGEDIYGGSIHGYLYLPQACILFAPFAEFPFTVGEVLGGFLHRDTCGGGLEVVTFCRAGRRC